MGIRVHNQIKLFRIKSRFNDQTWKCRSSKMNLGNSKHSTFQEIYLGMKLWWCKPAAKDFHPKIVRVYCIGIDIKNTTYLKGCGFPVWHRLGIQKATGSEESSEKANQLTNFRDRKAKQKSIGRIFFNSLPVSFSVLTLATNPTKIVNFNRQFMIDFLNWRLFYSSILIRTPKSFQPFLIPLDVSSILFIWKQTRTTLKLFSSDYKTGQMGFVLFC